MNDPDQSQLEVRAGEPGERIWVQLPFHLSQRLVNEDEDVQQVAEREFGDEYRKLFG